MEDNQTKKIKQADPVTFISVVLFKQIHPTAHCGVNQKRSSNKKTNDI